MFWHVTARTLAGKLVQYCVRGRDEGAALHNVLVLLDDGDELTGEVVPAD